MYKLNFGIVDNFLFSLHKILYKCTSCNEPHKNIMAKDDNMELIIELSKAN